MRRRRVAWTTTLIVTATVAGSFGSDPSWSGAAVPIRGDFNGDGRADLVIGVPAEDTGGAVDAGALHVLAGTPLGIRTRGSQFWNQDSDGIADVGETGDGFASAVATGDFDDDSYADLVVGVPCETIGAASCAGSITVLYGSPFGLTPDWSTTLHQDTVGIAGVAETDDRFGAALVAGDFNADGRDDLAVGAPGEDLDASDGAGVVYVLVGGPGGLGVADSKLVRSEAVGQVSETGDGFGSSLATGSFDGGAAFDLVIGTPGEDGAVADSGSITVVPGSPTGLVNGGAATFTQDTIGVPGRSEANDGFGTTLAVGDFDGDDDDDLAVGVPNEAIGAIAAAGAVHLFEGSDDGITSVDSRVIWQGAGMRGGSESNDRAGAALAAGDFDDDGRFDLAVGIPGESYSGFVRAGQVLVMRGTVSGINVVGTTTWNQDVGGIAEVPEDEDAFGSALMANDYNGDGRSDLAVGVRESLDAVTTAGGVHVLYGSASGVFAEGDQFFSQDSASVPDPAESGDDFGRVLG